MMLQSFDAKGKAAMKREINDPLSKIPKHLEEMIPDSTKQRIAENQALQVALYELVEIMNILEQDVKKLVESGKDDLADQTWRRSAYRAVFSWIEGVVYQMKQVAVCTQGGFYQAKFSRAEIAFLQEESYHLDDKGRVKTKYNNFSEIDRNLRFAYVKLVEGLQLSTKLEVGERGWEQLKEAKKIRNCLTHPKNSSELIVTDENMQALSETIKWFNAQISKLVADAKSGVHPRLEQIRVEGKKNIQNISDNAKLIWSRAAKLEGIVSIIDELDTKSDDGKEKENFETIRLKLDEIKKEILSDVMSSKGSSNIPK